MLAEILDDPFVGRHFLGDCLLHELGACEHCGTRGHPIAPDKSLGFRGWRFGIAVAFAADHLAMFTALLAVAGNAKLFAKGAPTDDFDLFVFAHQAANFLARAAVSAMSAKTIVRPRPTSQAQYNRSGEE